jgi:hypothetical protein
MTVKWPVKPGCIKETEINTSKRKRERDKRESGQG